MEEQNSDNAFKLPEDYFSVSKRKITDRLLREEELKAFPLLSSVRDTGFTLPDDYFKASALRTAMQPYSPLLKEKQQDQVVFNVPENYFLLSSERLKAIYGDELTTEPEITFGRHPHGFTLPDDYFERNKLNILSALQGRREAKIIRLFVKRTAFAAAALLLVSLGIWLFKLKETPENILQEDCQTLACIEKRELLKFKLQHLETEELYELISAEELEKKLNTESPGSHAGTKQNDSADADLMDYLE